MYVQYFLWTLWPLLRHFQITSLCNIARHRWTFKFWREQPRFIMADSVRVPEKLPEHVQAYLDQKKHALQEEALACDILLLHFCQDEIPEVTRVTFKSKNYDGCSTTHVTPFGGGTCFFLTQKLGTFSVGSIDRMYERVHRVIQAITCLYRSQREHWLDLKTLYAAILTFWTFKYI